MSDVQLAPDEIPAATNRTGISDGANVEVGHPDDFAARDDFDSGPDPEQWDEPEARDEYDYVPAEDRVKGPSITEWSEEARAERGAEIVEVPEEDLDHALAPDEIG